MKFENQIQTEEGLRGWVEQNNKIILFGDKALVVILLRYMISINEKDRVRGLSYIQTKSERMVFDEFVIKPIEEYKPDADSKIVILIRHMEEYNLLRSRLADWEDKQICSVDYGLLAKLSAKDNVSLDFLCAGFTKCGTTSLYWALRKNKKIYMPREKESLYGKWKEHYLDAPDRFREMYFSGISKKRKWGCIEPTYYRRADFVYETFGNKPKLLFILRNPADATYSYFKMMMRRSDDAVHRMYFKRFKKYSPRMFQEYMKDDIFSGKDKRFLYDIWLKEFLQYFDKSAIKIIFFEELIKEQEKILREVQEFIGVKPVDDLTLPHANTGKKVSKNYFCARVNGKLHRRSLYYKENGTERQRIRFRKLRDFIWKFTLIENEEKISGEDRKILMDYYKDSIQEVEKIAGRSLKGIWYE